MGVFDNVRRVKIDGNSPGRGRVLSPRVVTVAEPERFQTTAFVSLAKGYIPDQVYLKSHAGAKVYEQGLNVIKRYNSKRRLAPF